MNGFARALVVGCTLSLATAHAASLGRSGGIADDAPSDWMSEADRQSTWRSIEAARARLVLPKAGARPAFRWPLRPARGYYGPVFSRVSNHVDHDAAFPGMLRDFTCGTRTYDRANGYNHQGTDIAIVPDSWNLMTAGQIEIVAAAPGTIVSRIDGNFDRNCAFGDTQWNAVFVQHEDGSVAWYGHMKRGSVTPKRVGDRVVAGEYLGLVGSSGNSTGPHLHLEVYDASGRLIDPYAGACNPLNSESWWENQPAYEVTQVMALTLASAEPAFSTCGDDGRLVDPGDFHRKSAFAPGERLWLVVNMRDLPMGSRVLYTLRDPSGAIFQSIQGEVAERAFASAIAWDDTVLPLTVPLGNWMAEARIGESKVEIPFTVSAGGAAIPDYTDLWWNPSESGWGMNINHQGETIFATWFTYDADGAGLWLVMPAGSRQADGSFAGSLYRTTGVPFAQINGAPAITGAPSLVGAGTLRFTDAEHAIFGYTVNGIAQSKALQRQRFAAPYACMGTRGSRANATSYQDLWWNASESGWGINLTHQGDTIFATWFTYGAGGRGIWIVGPDTRRQATGEFRGRLYRTNGTAFDRISGSPALQGTPADVGEIVLTFTDGEHGRLDYTLDGVTQSKAIERQVFAAGVPLCR